MNNSFCERLLRSCERHSDRTAMSVVGDPAEKCTYAELLTRIRSTAFRLGREGIEKGDRVAVFGANHPAWAVAYLATLYAGAVCVPVDPDGEPETLANFFGDAEVKACFLAADKKERFFEITSSLDQEIIPIVWKDTGNSGLKRFEEFSETPFTREYGAAVPQVSSSDPAVLIYTSGTTGKPKGVPLTHGNICAELDAIDNVLEISANERILSVLPLFHAYLQIANLWIASTKGAEVFYLKELKPEELARAMSASRMTILATVPRLWYLFHKRILDEVRSRPRPVRALFRSLLIINGFVRGAMGINLGKLFFPAVHRSFGGRLRLAISAGSRFDKDVAIDFHRLGFTILQGYGLTETSGAATATHIDDNRVGSVGKPVLGAEVKIGEPDRRGEGEVMIRGPIVFDGYYRNPDATHEAFTPDGWFRSGDLGRFDDDGHLYITGRAKDVIVLPSGKNVHPEDLEVHYSRSPLVAEMCVVGVEDTSLGVEGAERLAAVIVPDFEYLKAKNLSNAKEAIRYDLDNRGRQLPEHQRVRDYFLRSDVLPRTATRKIKRFEVRKDLHQRDDLASAGGPAARWTFSPDDRALLESPPGVVVLNAIARQREEAIDVHPDMNLEIDLRMDSLARAEVFAELARLSRADPDGDAAAQALTIRDLIMIGDPATARVEKAHRAMGSEWSEILNKESAAPAETDRVFRDRPVFAIFAFVVLRVFYVFCRVFLRMKITGRSHLEKMDAPFLICPNHQSYLDAFVISSTYPYSVLKRIFHVGASEYFEGFIMRNVAGILNIVPIDPDTNLTNAMRAGAAGLRRGRILNIYPEGERAFDGALHEFKNGAAILSTELDMPIVPVAVNGLHRVWARGSKRIRLAKVKLAFGEPLEPAPETGADYGHLTVRLKNCIHEMLDRMKN